MNTLTEKSFWADLETWREDPVRVKIAARVFGNVSIRLALAEEWLSHKDGERTEAADTRNIAYNLETNHIARSTRNAAWISAIAAIIATICAIIAVMPHFSL